MLSAPDATPETLKQFADINGLSFDPRDVEAFFAAKARGENSNVPIPIIDPGDGRTGATARGFGDPIGFLDEMGAAVDAVGGTDHRESIRSEEHTSELQSLMSISNAVFRL